jgi:cobalt-zinc-cadmium efflux system protein
MAHFQKQVGAALLLNTGIVAVEAVASIGAGSLSLLVDGIHNASDELALACLYLAFFVPGYLSRQSQRVANVLNSLGLITLSGIMIWQAIDRLTHPVPLHPLIPIGTGVLAAVTNYGVYRLLRSAAADNTAVRLAYLHNWGDIWISLAPVAAGVLVGLSGRAAADVLVALVVALMLAVTTLRELRSSADDLLWPAEMTCGHADGEAA